MISISTNSNISREVILIEKYLSKIIDLNELSFEMGKSMRTCYRKLKRFKLIGLEGLTHRLKGQKGNRSLKEEYYNQVKNLLIQKYLPITRNCAHIKDLLLETHQISLSTTTLYKIIRENNLFNFTPKKLKKVHYFREPKACFGELIQLDTSIHKWFNDEKYQLILMIDDATSKIVYARLEKHDGTLSNFRALDSLINQYGIPKAIYTDKASWFYTNQSFKSKLLNLKHESNTQWELALKALGIKAITAHSSQAKGRVERANKTLQDRLISELKLNGVNTLEEANAFIENIYIKKHNERFSRNPQSSENMFLKKIFIEDELKMILSKNYEAKVRNDNTVKLEGGRIFLQIEKTPFRYNWARAHVILKAQIDGKLKLIHKITNEDIPFKIIKYQPFKELKYSYNEFEEVEDEEAS